MFEEDLGSWETGAGCRQVWSSGPLYRSVACKWLFLNAVALWAGSYPLFVLERGKQRRGQGGMERSGQELGRDLGAGRGSQACPSRGWVGEGIWVVRLSLPSCCPPFSPLPCLPSPLPPGLFSSLSSFLASLQLPSSLSPCGSLSAPSLSTSAPLFQPLGYSCGRTQGKDVTFTSCHITAG